METYGLIFLDTSFVIAVLRGNGEASAKISQLRKTNSIGISSIARAELFHGAFKKPGETKVGQLKALLSFFISEPFDQSVDEMSGKLMADLDKTGQTVDFRDVAIAATALKHGGKILTLNKKHFEKIPGITVL